MEFRLTKPEEASIVNQIIQDGKTVLKDNQIPQWQGEYPNINDIYQDIACKQSYVLLQDDVIIGSAALLNGEEPTYRVIQEGEWMTHDTPYMTIHRIAVASDYQNKGLSHQLFAAFDDIALEKGVKSIRIDTHHLNTAMQRLLVSHGYRYCGIIIVQDGTIRDAFEKLL